MTSSLGWALVLRQYGRKCSGHFAARSDVNLPVGIVAVYSKTAPIWWICSVCSHGLTITAVVEQQFLSKFRGEHSRHVDWIVLEAMDVKVHSYHVPSLQEIADVLQKGLVNDFAEVSATVVNCPDLTKEPFHLAAEGLSGSQRICDVGGVPYLVPLYNPEKKYNFEEVAKLAGVPDGFFVGAGAGPFHVVGTNSELMPNIKCGADRRNETHYARITESGGHLMERVPQNSSDFGLMSNVFLSEGKSGNVLRLHLKRRVGKDNLTAAVRKVLLEAFGPEKPVGLGGVFLIKSGKAKLHIMPAFSETPLKTDEEVGEWLRYFEFPAPLICLSVMSSCDPGWDLRIDHTHCFSTHGAGGHYHYDTTPDDVEYECFFNVAEKLVRVDQPKETHNIGRD